MYYETFLQTVKEDLDQRLGIDYHVALRMITKNNGVVREGVSICRNQEDIAPTIYLDDFYKDLEAGQAMPQICDRIYHLYLENPGLPYLDSTVLSSFPNIRDHIVFKLINTQANRTLLKQLPHLPFHDMSMICYLLMEQREQGYVTALIYRDHLKTWKIQEKELFLTAMKNTPALLPPTIQPMGHVLKRLAQDALGDEYEEATVDALLEEAEKKRMEQNPLFPALYVLTNPAGVNGAACIAYPNIIKNFAKQMDQDLLILPSSIHEVLLVTDSENYDYEDMSRLVHEINCTEVPVEDRLSNQIYHYSRKEDQIRIVSHGPSLERA